jgi:hypothetical protein
VYPTARELRQLHQQLEVELAAQRAAILRLAALAPGTFGARSRPITVEAYLRGTPMCRRPSTASARIGAGATGATTGTSGSATWKATGQNIVDECGRMS